MEKENDLVFQRTNFVHSIFLILIQKIPTREKSVKSINLRHCRYLASYNPSFFYLSNFLAFKAKSVLSYLSYHTRKYYPVAYLVEDKPFFLQIFLKNFNYQQKSGNMRTNF